MKGILFASFGTTHDDARTKAIDAVAEAVAGSLDCSAVYQAYTSGMIRRALAKRGIEISDVSSALKAMSEAGVDEALVSVGHVLPGEEYYKVRDSIDECSGLFSQIALARPLISGSEDLSEISDILSKRYPAVDGTAYILMGHGTPTFANVVYAALDYHFGAIGRHDIAVATVEAYPMLEEAMGKIRPLRAKHVTLAPLMLVAGDHAVNDMAGDDPESWASILRADGLEVSCNLVGMGEIPGIRGIYIDHAKKAAATIGWE